MISVVTAVKLSCEETGCGEARYEKDGPAVGNLARINGWRAVGWQEVVEGQEMPKMTLYPVHRDITDAAGK